MEKLILKIDESELTIKGFEKIIQQSSLSNYITVFDFDGVICDEYEDQVFKLPVEQNELPILSKATKVFDYSIEYSDLQYQRHLIYQAALEKLNKPIRPGPCFSLLKSLNKKNMP